MQNYRLINPTNLFGVAVIITGRSSYVDVPVRIHLHNISPVYFH